MGRRESERSLPVHQLEFWILTTYKESLEKGFPQGSAELGVSKRKTVRDVLPLPLSARLIPERGTIHNLREKRAVLAGGGGGGGGLSAVDCGERRRGTISRHGCGEGREYWGQPFQVHVMKKNKDAYSVRKNSPKIPRGGVGRSGELDSNDAVQNFLTKPESRGVKGKPVKRMVGDLGDERAESRKSRGNAMSKRPLGGQIDKTEGGRDRVQRKHPLLRQIKEKTPFHEIRNRRTYEVFIADWKAKTVYL